MRLGLGDVVFHPPDQPVVNEPLPLKFVHAVVQALQQDGGLRLHRGFGLIDGRRAGDGIPGFKSDHLFGLEEILEGALIVQPEILGVIVQKVEKDAVGFLQRQAQIGEVGAFPIGGAAGGHALIGLQQAAVPVLFQQTAAVILRRGQRGEARRRWRRGGRAGSGLGFPHSGGGGGRLVRHPLISDDGSGGGGGRAGLRGRGCGRPRGLRVVGRSGDAGLRCGGPSGGGEGFRSGGARQGILPPPAGVLAWQPASSNTTASRQAMKERIRISVPSLSLDILCGLGLSV